jgi:ATPase subunit of ABC transporter with duplicated ATPase domains
MVSLAGRIEALDSLATAASASVERLRTRAAEAQQELDIVTQSDVVLRALLQQRTDAAFGEVEQLLTRGLQTVFGPEWEAVRIVCSQKLGRLWGELRFVHEGVEAPPLDAFGGGAMALADFLLRLLVVRRMKLAPVLVLDEPFSHVSASALPALARFLRLLVDKLDLTIVLVTHQPKLIEAATIAYRAGKEGGRTVFTRIAHEEDAA